MDKARRNSQRTEERRSEPGALATGRSRIKDPVLTGADLLLVLATCFLLSVTGGCNSINKKPQGDPLFGGVKPQPGLTGAANSPVPPLPGPTTTASTAALASVNPRPVDGSHDLRIPDSANGQMTAGGQGFGPSGTQLQPPVMGAPTTPGFAPVSRQGQTVANPGAATGSSNLSYEAAQARLTSYGVAWQRLETWGDQGDWKFTCSIPNRQNPYISRTYEAEAHDPLAAVHGVLDQLEHDQR
jgi:hypothetical protein